MALEFVRKLNMSPGQRDTGDVIDADDINELQEALEAIAESGAGFSYRDRQRREFMRIPVDSGLEIEDMGSGGYDVSARIKSVLHVEGVRE